MTKINNRIQLSHGTVTCHFNRTVLHNILVDGQIVGTLYGEAGIWEVSPYSGKSVTVRSKPAAISVIRQTWKR